MKSGATGTLKSLHLYMDMASHNMAIRFLCSPKKHYSYTSTEDKKYFLITLPYFDLAKIEGYIIWFEEEVKKM